MLILVKSFDSVKEAGLLKVQLKKDNIEAYSNELGAGFDDHRYPVGHAVAVDEEFFEKALQILRALDQEEKNLSPHSVNCPNCGSRSLNIADLVKADLKKVLAYCKSSLSAMLSLNKSKYHICNSCGLEYTKSN